MNIVKPATLRRGTFAPIRVIVARILNYTGARECERERGGVGRRARNERDRARSNAESPETRKYISGSCNFEQFSTIARSCLRLESVPRSLARSLSLSLSLPLSRARGRLCCRLHRRLGRYAST